MDADFQEREFQLRQAAVLKECDLAPQVFADVSPRLEQFMEPFVDNLVRQEQVGPCVDLCARLAVGSGASECRVDRLPLWPRSDAVAVVHRRIEVG